MQTIVIDYTFVHRYTAPEMARKRSRYSKKILPDRVRRPDCENYDGAIQRVPRGIGRQRHEGVAAGGAMYGGPPAKSQRYVKSFEYISSNAPAAFTTNRPKSIKIAAHG